MFTHAHIQGQNIYMILNIANNFFEYLKYEIKYKITKKRLAIKQYIEK